MFESVPKEEKFEQDFKRLEQIAQILKESGLNVTDRFINRERLKDPSSEVGFPVVSDGVDGIRISYSKHSGLQVWFTNGFEDPSNPKRKEVTEKLKEAGLWGRD